VSLGKKWKGEHVVATGHLELKPKDAIESFFHKIVMMRDRLRVLEQK
jgi:hypothetical protein